MPEEMRGCLDLSSEEMDAVWQKVAQITGAYRDDIQDLRVAPTLDLNELRRSISSVDFNVPLPWPHVFDWLDHHMRNQQLHAGHAGYFGLFNPAPVPLGIAADALAAAYNAQLAAWSHSPFANELERYLIQEFGLKFGLPEGSIDGTFCTGGAEANHTALLCALAAKYPEYARLGVRALPGQPTLYISEFAHHSWIKAARACGLGSLAVRSVPGDETFRLCLTKLQEMLERDLRSGLQPLLICGTAGTTGAGSIDPLDDIAGIAQAVGCWYHVDAAWGGAARFVPEFANWLCGIEKADSITFDAHKFLSIPMSAGVFLTRHREILSATFSISTDYMPHDAPSLDVIEPHSHSMQWSRRFIGLKIFLPLASAGWTELANVIRSQCRLGAILRNMLCSNGWNVINETPLPLVCFIPGGGDGDLAAEAIAKRVVDSGLAWISTVKLHRSALRACITNFRTTESDLTELVKILQSARIDT